MKSLLKTIAILTASALSLASCVRDETDGLSGQSGENVFINIQYKEADKSDEADQVDFFAATRDIHVPEDEHPGTNIDSDITTLRIMAFEQNGSKNCVSNVLYEGIGLQRNLRHSIKKGDYHFVFIANEPSSQSVRDELDVVTNYSRIDEITFSHDAFTSERYIPMIDIIENVSVLDRGEVSVASAAKQQALDIELTRLAVRIDVWLEAVENLDSEFTGITLSNLPNKVPLTANYTDPGSITRTEMRTINVNDDPGYFGSYTPTNSNVWGKTVSRVIIPSSVFTPKADDSKAVKFTANMKNAYNPDCLLQIESNPVDYTLKRDIKLDLTATIKMPLDVNIKASDWTPVSGDWNIDQIWLNLSQNEVSITHFNGARITFESNASYMRLQGFYDASGVLAPKPDSGLPPETDMWSYFQELQWPTDWGRRFSYQVDPATLKGTGYVDILVNGGLFDREGTYYLVLGAKRFEEWDKPGGMVLNKYIKVNVRRAGNNDFWFSHSGHLDGGNTVIYGTSYVGAFWQNNQVGERIIQAMTYNEWWDVAVPDQFKDWIVLSSTPSFDPNVGTNNPGDAEDFPVVANALRGEDGTRVTGRHRMYFRIGLKSQNTDPVNNRYGYVTVRYLNTVTTDAQGNISPPLADQIASARTQSYKLYIRQGDTPDYLMRSQDEMKINNVVTPRNASYVRKIPIYNLTAVDMLDIPGSNPWDMTKNYVRMDTTRMGVFVKYPTQAGAYFQWGMEPEHYQYARRAYYPRFATGQAGLEFDNIGLGAVPNSVWREPSFYQNYFWDAPAGPAGPEGNGQKAMSEVCPPGYHRPNNGSTTAHSTNNTAADVAKSEFMLSVYENPMVGDAHDTQAIPPGSPIVHYDPVPISNCAYGRYADGFFDRHAFQRGYLDPSNPNEGDPGSYSGVWANTPQMAMVGSMFFNPHTNASVFFPAAGRRGSKKGDLQYRGGTGFYWTTTWGNQLIDTDKRTFTGPWAMELSFLPAPVTSVAGFGHSIRCIKD